MNALTLMTEMMTTLNNNLSIIDSELNKGYTILDSNPFVVASSDCFYSVGRVVRTKLAKVEIQTIDPYMFTFEQANDILENYSAYAVDEKITWYRYTRNQFLQIRRNQIVEQIETYQAYIDMNQ